MIDYEEALKVDGHIKEHFKNLALQAKLMTAFYESYGENTGDMIAESEVVEECKMLEGGLEKVLDIMYSSSAFLLVRLLEADILRKGQ